MTGWASSIISPSRVTITRSTPWVAGCWGPTFRVMSWVCSSRSALSRTMMPTPVPSAAWNAAPPPLSSSLATALLPRLLGARPWLGLPGQQGELLAEREALELLRQQQLGQVGVPVEDDPEQLPGLPLVPVGAGPEVAHGGQPAAVPRHHRPYLQVVVVAGGVDVEDDADAGGLLVHAAEELEEVAGELRVVAGQLGHAPPVPGVHGDGQQPVGDLRLDRVRQLRDQVVAHGLRVHYAPAPTTMGSSSPRA